MSGSRSPVEVCANTSTKCGADSTHTKAVNSLAGIFMFQLDAPSLKQLLYLGTKVAQGRTSRIGLHGLCALRPSAGPYLPVTNYIFAFTAVHGYETHVVSAAPNPNTPPTRAMDDDNALALFKTGRLDGGMEAENITVALSPTPGAADENKKGSGSSPSLAKSKEGGSVDARRGTKLKRPSSRAAKKASTSARSDQTGSLTAKIQSNASDCSGPRVTSRTATPAEECHKASRKAESHDDHGGKAVAVPPKAHHEPESKGSPRTNISSDGPASAQAGVLAAAEASADVDTTPAVDFTEREPSAAGLRGCIGDDDALDPSVRSGMDATTAVDDAAPEDQSSGSPLRENVGLAEVTGGGNLGDPAHNTIEALIGSLNVLSAKRAKCLAEADKISRALDEAQEVVMSATSELDAIAVGEQEMSDAKNRMQELKEELHKLEQKVQAYDASAPTRTEKIHDLKRNRSDGESRRSGLKRQLDEEQRSENKRRAVIDRMHGVLRGGAIDVVDIVT